MTYNSCPLCYLRKTIPKISKDIALKIARVPGVHIRVRKDRCTGCGACVKKRFCLINAISVVNRKARVDDRLCRGCGRCTHFCPRRALELDGITPAFVQGAINHINPLMEMVFK